MPVLGSFHAKYWAAHANPPPALAEPAPGGYPLWQTVIVGTFWGWSGDFWTRLWWTIRIAWQLLWEWRDPVQRRTLERWLVPFSAAFAAVDEAERRICWRLLLALTAPEWPEARARVRACAGTLNFSDPKMWQTYSRALRANVGQAQNVYRHIKAVQELQACHPALSNPQAHLLVELAYQGYAMTGRPARRIIPHAKRIIRHPVLHIGV